MNEAIPIDCFLTSGQKRQFQFLNGEGIARILCEGRAEEAYGILDQAEIYASNRGKERARWWLISCTGVVALIVVVAVGVAWILREQLASLLGPTSFQLLLGACAGAVGAWASIVTRSSTISVEPSAGKWLHYLEAVSRMAVGAFGAVIVALGIQTKLILPNLPDNGFKGLVLVCLIAGVSERLVPGLIRKVEASAGGGEDTST